MKSINGQRAFKDVPDIPKGASIEEVINTVNDLISDVSFLSKYLSLQSNFDCQILKVVFAAGETKTVPHSLAVVPKYRMILRQEGNGVLTDIPSGWNNFSIQLKNEGAVQVTATIVILRE